MQIPQLPKNSWFTSERELWLAAILFAGVAGFGIGNGHTTQGAILNVSQQLGDQKAVVRDLKTKVIPKLKAESGCEKKRADKTAAVATKAIIGAVVDTAPIPSPKEIPADNCPHPVAK